MKSIKLTYFLILFLIISSCNNDSNSSQSPSSRNVKYEITGSATGSFDTTYISSSGSGENEIFTALPWSKEFTADASVSGITLQAAVSGAVPGQTISAKILVGGVVKREGIGVVQNNNIGIVVLQPYVLE